MIFIWVAAFLLSFAKIVDCRVGQRFLTKTPEQHQSQLGSNFTDGSKSGFIVGNGTIGLDGSCSFSGPSWDPLLSCFDARGPIADVIRHNLRCKLKKELAFETQAAWSSRAASFKATEPYGKNGSGHHIVLGAKANDDKVTKYAHVKDHHHMELLVRPETNEKRFRKCAVVSNSGVLRRHRHGNAIDNADLVFRFNDAPLGGWDNFVGAKESIRIVNDQFPKRVVEHEIATYDFQTNTLYGIVGYGGIPGLYGLRGRYPTTSIKVLDEGLLKSFAKTLQSIYDGHWFHDGYSFQPTTGAVGMLSAMSRCDEVLAYGMAATQAAGNSPHHYYKEDEPYSIQSRKADENTWHRSFKAEKDLWRRVARNAPHEIDATDVAIIPGFSQMKCD